MKWLFSKSFDLTFLHGPVWLTWLIVLLLPKSYLDATIPVWVWVVAVLFIDVGHVWSSIYRTYLDPTARKHHGNLLFVLPIICFAIAFSLAQVSSHLFWRVLAYIAVFHFIKQQVGITALYAVRHAKTSGLAQSLSEVEKRKLMGWDRLAIYAGTLGPVIYWHFAPQKPFNWFVANDFLPLYRIPQYLSEVSGGPWLTQIIKLLFFGVWIAVPLYWLFLQLKTARRFGTPLPTGKLFWVGGTALNWFLGIVAFNSDLAFTITNVVAHGIPYYALIGRYSLRKWEDGGYSRQKTGTMADQLPIRTVAKASLVLAGLGLILAVAFVEEYLWNGLLYREYGSFFNALLAWPAEQIATPFWEAFWIALLSIPQTVHYVLDGFIWKFNGKNPDLGKYLLG